MPALLWEGGEADVKSPGKSLVVRSFQIPDLEVDSENVTREGAKGEWCPRRGLRTSEAGHVPSDTCLIQPLPVPCVLCAHHCRRQARAVGPAAWWPPALGGEAECRSWRQPYPFRSEAPVSLQDWASEGSR